MRLSRVVAAANSTFRALVARTKGTPATMETLDSTELPQKSNVKASPGNCDTTVKIEYSTVNYKDALVVMGKYPGLKFPMVAGIDLVGSIVSSEDPMLRLGQKVLINGFGIGTDHFGGIAELASVRGKWCLPLSEAGNVTALDAARIGTAGYTAMLCVDALASRVKQDKGPVVVTGATGGVGSVTISLLSQLGYHVVAVTGKASAESEYLKNLGAKEIVDRTTVCCQDETPILSKELYAGAVDVVGGVLLANILARIMHGGSVAICGMAGGMELAISVAPFILRGVSLLGIESVYQDMAVRQRVYQKYVPLLTSSGNLEAIGGDQIVTIEHVPEVAEKMLKGQHRGRYVVGL